MSYTRWVFLCKVHSLKTWLRPPSCFWYQEYFLGSVNPTCAGNNDDLGLHARATDYPYGVLDGVHLREEDYHGKYTLWG